MTRYEALRTAGAERDLESIYDYIAEFDSPARASYVLDRFIEVTNSLSRAPHCGSHPRELIALGMRDYRQSFFKPYRLNYRIVDQRVILHLIADGRRNMQTLLARRLLG